MENTNSQDHCKLSKRHAGQRIRTRIDRQPSGNRKHSKQLTGPGVIPHGDRRPICLDVTNFPRLVQQILAGTQRIREGLVIPIDPAKRGHECHRCCPLPLRLDRESGRIRGNTFRGTCRVSDRSDPSTASNRHDRTWSATHRFTRTSRFARLLYARTFRARRKTKGSAGIRPMTRGRVHIPDTSNCIGRQNGRKEIGTLESGCDVTHCSKEHSHP
jgi:hypothetical protein